MNYLNNSLYKHTFWVRKRNVSLRRFFYAHKACLIGKKTDDNHFCGVICSHVYLPIFLNLDTSK